MNTTLTLTKVLEKYMTEFEARLCINELARLGFIPWQWPVIEGEVVQVNDAVPVQVYEGENT